MGLSIKILCFNMWQKKYNNNKEKGNMKTYEITMQYDVQKTYYVRASSKQAARNKLDDYGKWEKDIETSQSMEDWEYRNTL